MAKVVKCFPSKIRSKYRRYADGRAWKLDLNRDFTNISNVIEGVGYVAQRMGKKHRAHQEGNSLYIQVH